MHRCAAANNSSFAFCKDEQVCIYMVYRTHQSSHCGKLPFAHCKSGSGTQRYRLELAFYACCAKLRRTFWQTVRSWLIAVNLAHAVCQSCRPLLRRTRIGAAISDCTGRTAYMHHSNGLQLTGSSVDNSTNPEAVTAGSDNTFREHVIVHVQRKCCTCIASLTLPTRLPHKAGAPSRY